MVDIGLVVALCTLILGVYVGVSNIKKNNLDMSNDDKVAEIVAKLEYISDEVKKIDRITDKLNSQLERIVIVEQSVKSCHRRLDDNKKL